MTPDTITAAAVLRDRAGAMRRAAGSADPLVATAYRRRAAELELVAAIADAPVAGAAHPGPAGPTPGLRAA
jgi:hypothetical protein